MVLSELAPENVVAELTRLYNTGDSSAAVRRELQHRLDLEHASLGP